MYVFILRVPWLQGTFQPNIIHDDDAWKIKDHNEESIEEKVNVPIDTIEPREPKEPKEKWMKIIYEIVQFFVMFLSFLSFILFHTLAFYSKTQNWPNNPGNNDSDIKGGTKDIAQNELKNTDDFILNTILVCCVVELACLALLVVRSWQNGFTLSRKSWMIAPYLYSCGVCQVINANPKSKSKYSTKFCKAQVS